MKYSIAIDKLTQNDWQSWALTFSDYTIYQTWPYQQVRSQMDNQQLSRIVIKNEDDQVVLMCQVRVKRIKPLGLNIGYAQWGPLYRSQNNHLTLDTQVLELLRDTCFTQKINVLRLVPNVVDDADGKKFANLLKCSGFHFVPDAPIYRTIYFPVDDDEQSMRNRFHRSWRRELKKAENNNIEIQQGSSPKFFDVLKELYADAKHRKGFQGLHPDVFSQTQQMLPSDQKIHVVLAYYKNQPVTAHASSFLGSVAEGIIAGSSPAGLECRSAYLVWWKTFQAAHSAGMKLYNLGGIDPKNNPSVYQFKKRSGGYECNFIGTFDTTSGPLVRKIWRNSEKIFNWYKKSRH